MKSGKKGKLYRGPKAIAGVCSGIAEYFSIDVIIVRIAWVILSFFSVFLAVIPYLVLWIALPQRPLQEKTVVDVNPISVQSVKYESVVDSSAVSQKNVSQHFGVNAGAGHIPPEPPLNAQATTFNRQGQAVGNSQAFSQIPTKEQSVSTSGSYLLQDKADDANVPSIALAAVLGLGLILFFTLVAHVATTVLPGVSFFNFYPMLFIVVGIVIVAVPVGQRSFITRICIFAVCCELCCLILPFSLGLVTFEALGRINMFTVALWITVACLVLISFVSPSEIAIIALAVIAFLAVVFTFVDIGVFDRIVALASLGAPHKKSILMIS